MVTQESFEYSTQEILANKDLNLNQKFEFLVKEIFDFLKLDPLYDEFKASIKDVTKKEQLYSNFGVIREIKDGVLCIVIENRYSQFLPILLLREAYLSFIPENLISKDYIHIFINRILEITIKKELIEQYKSEIRKFIIDSENFRYPFDLMHKFFLYPENRILFFKIVRRSGTLMKDFKFYDFFLEIIKEDPHLFYNEDIIETIYVFKEIFYRKELFTSLEDYKNAFKAYVDSKIIPTDLSLRNFVNNLQLLKKTSYISANHYINYQAINYGLIYIIIQFHADNHKKILEEILNFPQLSNYYLSYSTSNVEGIFVLNLPLTYLENIKKIFFNLKNAGYIDHILFGKREFYKHTLNLNFLLSKFKNRIPHQDEDYIEKYEMSFSFDFSNYKREFLDPIDIVLFNRIPNFSLTGFSLDKKKILNDIKKDLSHIILNQNILIENLYSLITEVKTNPNLKQEIITYLTKKANKGIFSVQPKISNLIDLSKAIKTFLENDKGVQLTEFKSLLFGGKIFQDLKKNYLLKKIEKKDYFFHNWVELYYQEPKKFNDNEFKNILLFKLLSSFQKINIFSFKKILNFIKQHNSLKFLSQKRKNLETLSQIYKSRNLNSEALYQKIQNYLNHNAPIIKPFLLNSISTFHISQYLPSLVLNFNSFTLEKLKRIEPYFLRTVTIHFTDFLTRKKMIHTVLFSIKLTRYERRVLLSILYQIFQLDILLYKRYAFSSVYKSLNLPENYNFQRQKMMYPKDLFSEYKKNLKEIFPSKLPYESKITESRKFLKIIWESEKISFEELIEHIDVRVQKEKINFNKVLLGKLTYFYQKFSLENFKSEIDQDIVQQYVKSVKFVPLYNKFGFSKYILFFTSFDPDKLDLRLLLSNTFTNVEIPCEIQDTLTMKVDFISPFRNFNDSYLNWYAKSLHNMKFYSCFMIKKIYSLFHFDINFTTKGWKLNALSFKSHIQKMLFDPAFKEYIYKLKKFNIGVQQTEILGIHDIEFKRLTEVYPFEIHELSKKTLYFSKHILDSIGNLLKKGLIFPLIAVKNLDLKEKLCIGLPKVKKEHIKLFLKIFHYFNYGYIYEIEGNYYEYGKKEYFFENGLYIEIFLPYCDLPKFKKVLIDLFAYLDYEDYFIIDDLVPGDNVIKNVFHEFDPSTYNPLLNLEWNEIDKIWMNEKFFDEKFVPKYPDLNPKYKL